MPILISSAKFLTLLVSGSEISQWDGLDVVPADDCRVYACLTRPLPDYAIRHVFSKFGPIEYVQLQHDDRCVVGPSHMTGFGYCCLLPMA